MAAFNGTGTYVRSYNWVADKTNGINITASRMDTEDDGLAAALTLCVTRDGQGKMAANFLPSSDAAYDLGSVTFRWKNLTISGNAAIGGTLNVTGNVAFGGNLTWTPPYFNAERITSTQSITSGVTTDLIFNTAIIRGGGYAIGTGIFTVVTAGLYTFSAGLRLQNSGIGTAVLNSAYFSINNSTSAGTETLFELGGTVNTSFNPGSNPSSFNGSMTALLSVGDTVRVKCNFASGTGLTFNANSYFTGALIAAS